MSWIYPLSHAVWAVFALAAVNLLPGYALYRLLKGKEYDAVEAIGLSLLLSQLINTCACVLLGLIGSPIWASLAVVQALSLAYVYRLHGRRQRNPKSAAA